MTTTTIKSLSTWSHLFHPIDGTCRLPNTSGESVIRLDVDIRFVDEECNAGNEIHLPNVHTLILRGGEYCQEDDERMEALAMVLGAVNPSVVQWLHASENLDEQYSFSTHLVHRAIIAAGRKWTRLQQLVVQGGFPCPNLTPPTPFAVTPVATPATSPRLGYFSALPSLSSFKPKPVSKERLERKRLAEYALKPRFEYAFGDWTPEQIRWRLDGRYTSAAIIAIASNLFKTVPSVPNPPSLLILGPVSPELYTDLREAANDMPNLAYLEDIVFVTLDETKSSRLFSAETDDEERLAVRFKAEMLLTGQGLHVAASTPLLSDGETDVESEAVTPEMTQSLILETCK